ncbi:16S rRNA m4C1402 methyltransferase [Oenococcus oeni]|uniref:Ribosomal RNA small subunit methyltransferase H n=1 Tax=Oenococcus oeni TaxID=1247 RepID=A0AAQ2UT50_OENOE|nr:16S rRNA (cytosine(1402)-N(4))-methyltransferase RsmH [Oenococcus oeni]SYW07454.1 16S rRNA m4C1402 methyltransferase [Oenococcus oeni]VDB98386.1 16S rRNA m4C1402 methyltransferase [Oenococcus oeni]
MTADYGHVTVFLRQAVENLAVKTNGIYVDATLGGGGHTDLLLKKAFHGHVYSFDQDENAIDFNKKRFSKEISEGRLSLIHSNFQNLIKELNLLKVFAIDGIVFDLGVSSPQFDDEKRGFSYRSDARLDMRMDQSQSLDAYQIVNTWKYKDLASIINRYGEEKFASSIARKIIKRREVQPIITTEELVETIKEALPDKILHKKGHPAKKTFQAIRIAVNDELNVLQEALKQASQLLNSGGRISVITFQSLEDRIVKHFFNQLATKNQLPSKLPVPDKFIQEEFKLLTKHPIIPSIEEIEENHRAHSAKLRVLEKN